MPNITPELAYQQTAAESGLLKLATPLIDTALRLRAGSLEPSPEARNSIVRQLQQLEEGGARSGYRDGHLRDARLALMAFMDQSAMTSQSPLRGQWGAHLLLVQYFGNVNAGVVFFERLQQLLNATAPGQATPQDVDVIEIYYHCLLLGYKGRFLVPSSDPQELQNIISATANWLLTAKRLVQSLLAPRGLANNQAPPRIQPRLPQWVLIGGGAWLWSLIVFGMILGVMLSHQLNK